MKKAKKKSKDPAQKVAKRTAKAEGKVAKAEGKLQKAAAKLEDRQAKLAKAKQQHQDVLAEVSKVPPAEAPTA